MKESLYPIKGSDVVFRETGNSLLDIQRNGGDPTDVIIDNGVMGFNGTTSLINYPFGQFFNFISESFSIRFRVKINIGTGVSRIISKGVFNSKGWNIFINNGQLNFKTYQAGVAQGTFSTTLDDGKWHEYIITRNGSSAIIYRDEVNVVSSSGTHIDPTDASDIVTQIGAMGSANLLDGDLDFMEVFNKELVISEVSNLYNKRQYKGLVTNGLAGYWDFTKGSSYDRSNNGNNGIDTLGTGGYKHNLGLNFDGTNTNIVVTDATNIQDIFDGGGTIFAVINPRSDGEGNLGVIINKARYYLQVLDESAGKVKIRLLFVFDGNNGEWKTTTTSVHLNINTFVAITYNSNSVSNDPIIYINGVPESISEIKTPTGTRESDISSLVTIGCNSSVSPTRTFDGIIKSEGMLNRILSAEEIAQMNQWAKTKFNL